MGILTNSYAVNSVLLIINSYINLKSYNQHWISLNFNNKTQKYLIFHAILIGQYYKTINNAMMSFKEKLGRCTRFKCMHIVVNGINSDVYIQRII